MPNSKLKAHIAEILKNEGYIAGFEVTDARVGKTLTLQLKFGPNRERSIAGIKRVSKPGLRVYAKSTELPKVLGGLGVAILSTSSGLLTDRQAEKKGGVGKSSPTCGSSMSRIGRLPIDIPAGVDVKVDGAPSPSRARRASSRSPSLADRGEGRGQPNRHAPRRRARLALAAASPARSSRTRSSASPRATSKGLEIVGTGYRVAQKDCAVEFALGFSHPVTVEPPAGITLTVEGNNKITVAGIDKQASARPPPTSARSRSPSRTGQGHPLRRRGRASQGRKVR